MLEIPEAATVARQLNDVLAGRTITSAQAGHTPHGFAFYWGEPEHYNYMLAGKRIDSVRNFAGQVEVAAEDMRLVLNDGLNLRYLTPDAKLPPKHQLHLVLDDGHQLIGTVQMYAGIMAFPAGANSDNAYHRAAREKPSVLGEDFTLEYFMSIVEETPKNQSVKALMATQQRIPGLGNGCLHDILFLSGLNPQTKLQSLAAADFERLYSNAVATLRAMTRAGGRDTEKDIYGQNGGYKTILSSKTYKNHCPACGGDLTRKAYMGGNVYFCPHCQPVLTA